jgi:hypothetical protein
MDAMLAGAELKSTRYHPGFFFTENFLWAALLQYFHHTTQFFRSLKKNGRRKESQVAPGFREYVYVFAVASLRSQSCRSSVDFLMGGVSAVCFLHIPLPVNSSSLYPTGRCEDKRCSH